MQWDEKGKRASAGRLITVAGMLWNFALEELEDHDVVDKNPFMQALSARSPPPQVVWEPEQIGR